MKDKKLTILIVSLVDTHSTTTCPMSICFRHFTPTKSIKPVYHFLAIWHFLTGRHNIGTGKCEDERQKAVMDTCKFFTGNMLWMDLSLDKIEYFAPGSRHGVKDNDLSRSNWLDGHNFGKRWDNRDQKKIVMRRRWMAIDPEGDLGEFSALHYLYSTSKNGELKIREVNGKRSLSGDLFPGPLGQ